jgi:hypothetical protein
MRKFRSAESTEYSMASNTKADALEAEWYAGIEDEIYG